MTVDEVLKEIKSRVKPYHDVKMEQGTFSNTIKAIEFGFAKQKTIEAFMAKFGYTKLPDQWRRQ